MFESITQSSTLLLLRMPRIAVMIPIILRRPGYWVGKGPIILTTQLTESRFRITIE